MPLKYGQNQIKKNKLQTFKNQYAHRDYVIEMNCPEFTAVCPKSGFPDFGTIFIKYIPNQKCIELKSLKLYINSYRTRRIFHEGAVNQILTDLVESCRPWRMEIVGDFNVRGNIKTVIRAKFQAPDYPTYPRPCSAATHSSVTASGRIPKPR
jgi:7-cyano-7-deazaguanine reductase